MTPPLPIGQPEPAITGPAPGGGLSADLAGLAEAAPNAAVTTAYSRIEARLAEMLDEAGLPSYTAVGGPALALLAR